MNINELYERITNNKIYVDLKHYENKNLNKQNYDEIFNNISLNYIKNNTDETNYKLDIKTQNNNSYNYIENSFLKELSTITFLELNEIKTQITKFVNSSGSSEYLKSLSRSYKKLRININNVLVKNLDNDLFNELIYIFCKVFNINIVILNDKTNIYNDFIIDEAFNYYLFNYHEKENNKNYKFKETINHHDKFNHLKKYNKKLELNKIKQMKINELKEIAKDYKVNITQKKTDLLHDLIKFT